ncbi:hypothetical protein GCM10011531_18130 [Aquaticitalea lipolytica]|uniref:Restriction endonuclease type IV Mrr domain-containing protein n=1 Tax=Aquaticitalea lipolytica TaxID=1247562 RepID=A0A8J2TPN3_9FLAO|nr:restriction endonuclease [Aquaticitalea lipolytica]GFZ87255.1 hypothetical protein GCM10011531_18130 [Aquaticitalea lipolytica]
MKDKPGIKFERLAESIFKKLVRNPNFEKVQHNVMLEGIDGKRQIDVLVSSSSFGFNYITVIECKDYKRRVSISDFDGFHSKLQDVKANKGVFISRKGFSTKVISKAKRLGITLCIADQTESDDWESIIDLPILLEEIILTDFDVNIRHSPIYNERIDSSVISEINGFDFLKLFKSKWGKDEFNLSSKGGIQEISFDEISHPIMTKTKDGEKFELFKFQVLAKVIVKNYRTSTSKLKNTQILDNITEGKKSVFIDVNSLKELDYNLFQVSKKDISNQTEFPCRVRIFPKFDLEISSFKINQNN